MEKINIVEILKDCPKGMELDCLLYDNIVFDSISDWVYPIKVISKDRSKSLNLTKYGCISENENAKCIIFPKGKTTWEGFQRPFKDGDVLTNERGSIFIYKGPMYYNKLLSDFYCGYRIPDGAFVPKLSKDKHFGEVSECRLATEEEKEKLFKAIKENGYKWNPETKTLEKLIEPKFKVGDRIKRNKDYISGIVTNIYDDGSYKVEYQSGGVLYVSPVYQNEWKLVSVVPKFKVGDRIRHKLTKNVYNILFVLSNGYDGGVYDVAITNEIGKSIDIKEQDDYELLPNKFDITTLKPFDRVLVRYNKDNKWCCSFFSHIDKEHHSHCYKYVTTAGKSYPYCIPYEDNKHLLGTTNNCDDYYKTW